MSGLDYSIGFGFFLALLSLVLVIYRFLKRKEILLKSNDLLRRENEALLNKIAALELENSKFRLNPHLFKNTLNSIQGYAYRTHHALEKLGGVLDYILYDSNVKFISLKEELEFAQNFIDLNKIKLNPLFDLKIKTNVNESSPFYSANKISPLITAHFIENAFKHADLHSSDAFITISFELLDNDFVFIVSNKVNKNPIFNPKGGIGNENMRQRMDVLYGTSIEISYSNDGDVYTSYLKINMANV